MVFSETAPIIKPKIDTNRSQLEAELGAVNQERAELGNEVINQWPDIPANAIAYLAETCSPSELMPLAIAEARILLKEDPTALDDPDISPFMLDDCIAQAEIVTKSNQRADNAETITTETSELGKDKTTRDVLFKEIAQKSEGKHGREQLQFAQDYLQNMQIDPETKERIGKRFSQIAAALDEMSNVFVDDTSRAAFESIIGTTSFDLGADNLAATLAPAMAQVETSNDFSQADKQKLRDIVTGSDAQAVMGETITDENGVTRPRYSQKHQREFRAGASGYTENQRQMVEGRAGDHLVTKDVTGWSGEDVGALIETMHMWNTLESFGSTGFVENIYKIDFSILGDGQAFDPLQIIRMRQILSHLVGGFEGYDGDIANLEDKKTLLHNQARLMSETQTAFGFENDQAGTMRVLQRLGMQDSNGKPNKDVIKAFGSYTQENYGGGDPDQLQLVDYLNKYYPQFVAPLTEAERQGGRLETEINTKITS